MLNLLNRPSSWKRFFTTLAISGCIVSSIPLISYAQGGLTIFGGIERENILNYRLDYYGRRKGRDRYRLRISGKKLIRGAARFFIKYPDYFDGKFDVDKVEVRVDKESLPIREVFWDKESQVIEIDLEEPLRESKKVELVFSNVKNPDMGTYYFHCDVLPAGDLPIREYVGTWIISISH